MTANGRVHLVGSVPLKDAASVFTAVINKLGDLTVRLPDGETGDRSHWIAWQAETFKACPWLEIQEEKSALPGTPVRKLYRIRDGRNPASLELPSLRYADAAKASFEVFERMKKAGQIPQTRRFQVSLPTSVPLVRTFFASEHQSLVEPIVERAMKREVDEIVSSIPHESIAVQWDIAHEVIAADGGISLHYAPVLEGSLERLGRHLDWIPSRIQAGIHLCYGDPGHKHVIEPKDLSTCVAFSNAIANFTDRRVDWIHMPVPRGRSDDAYFEPLKDLATSNATEIYLGLVHLTDGIEGTRKRLQVARRHLTGFGIATECGFGRRDPATVDELLDIHRVIARES